MGNTIELRKLSTAEVDELLELSRRTFFDTFYQVNKPEDMEAYASKVFTIEKLSDELNEPDSEFYFALLENKVVGYLKINFRTAQTELKDPQALEIERIYVLADQQGKNIGGQLMQFAINRAIDSHLTYVWLGVWDQNHKAIRFYQRHGFEVFSSHEFVLGSDKQTDLLLKRKVKGERRKEKGES
jgi:ribosomal protein S18 acetylase RimI-like enzyme